MYFGAWCVRRCVQHLRRLTPPRPRDYMRFVRARATGLLCLYFITLCTGRTRLLHVCMRARVRGLHFNVQCCAGRSEMVPPSEHARTSGASARVAQSISDGRRRDGVVAHPARMFYVRRQCWSLGLFVCAGDHPAPSFRQRAYIQTIMVTSVRRHDHLLCVRPCARSD